MELIPAMKIGGQALVLLVPFPACRQAGLKLREGDATTSLSNFREGLQGEFATVLDLFCIFIA